MGNAASAAVEDAEAKAHKRYQDGDVSEAIRCFETAVKLQWEQILLIDSGGGGDRTSADAAARVKLRGLLHAKAQVESHAERIPDAIASLDAAVGALAAERVWSQGATLRVRRRADRALAAAVGGAPQDGLLQPARMNQAKEAPLAGAFCPLPPGVTREAVHQCTAMGFDAARASAWLAHCGNDAERAIDRLLAAEAPPPEPAGGPELVLVAPIVGKEVPSIG